MPTRKISVEIMNSEIGDFTPEELSDFVFAISPEDIAPLGTNIADAKTLGLYRHGSACRRCGHTLKNKKRECVCCAMVSAILKSGTVDDWRKRREAVSVADKVICPALSGYSELERYRLAVRPAEQVAPQTMSRSEAKKLGYSFFTKSCLRCGQNIFAVNGWCTCCYAIYRAEFSDEIKANAREYKENNKNAISEWHKSNYIKNREKITIQQKEYARKNKYEISIRKSIYYKKNREKILLNGKIKDLENRDRRNSRYRARYKSDVEFRLTRAIRMQMFRVTKAIGYRKENKTFSILDYTPAQLKIHLESKWQAGMSWDNYGHGLGKWVIDHVVPIKAFFRYGIVKHKIINDIDNLVPMWYSENASKRDRVTKEQINFLMRLQEKHFG